MLLSMIFITFYLVFIPFWFYMSLESWIGFDVATCFNGFIMLDIMNILMIYMMYVFAAFLGLFLPCYVFGAQRIYRELHTFWRGYWDQSAERGADNEERG